jgi:hypothetical protein
MNKSDIKLNGIKLKKYKIKKNQSQDITFRGIKCESIILRGVAQLIKLWVCFSDVTSLSVINFRITRNLSSY